MVNKWIPKTGSNDKTSYGGLTINGGAGVSYFVKENISINAGLSYTNGKLKNKDDDNEEQRSSMFGGSIGISIFLN
jgi:opacity protein-like surface antigen